MEIKRGDIWYVSKDNYTGCEQAAGRPAIIVSNQKNNACSEVVEVVYLTTQPKKDLPTHVLIRSSERESTALCEQITTVSVDRLLGYKGHLTPAEMTNVEIAMLISLELEVGKPVEKSGGHERSSCHPGCQGVYAGVKSEHGCGAGHSESQV